MLAKDSIFDKLFKMEHIKYKTKTFLKKKIEKELKSIIIVPSNIKKL